MYKKRITIETDENKRKIIYNDYEYYENLLVAQVYTEEEQATSKKIDELLNINLLNDRSKFIIKSYIGYDGKCLTFKEIGKKLNLSESLIARNYKDAIKKLQEYYKKPPPI